MHYLGRSCDDGLVQRRIQCPMTKSLLLALMLFVARSTSAMAHPDRTISSISGDSLRCVLDQSSAELSVADARTSLEGEAEAMGVLQRSVDEWTTDHRLDWVMARRCIEWVLGVAAFGPAGNADACARSLPWTGPRGHEAW